MSPYTCQHWLCDRRALLQRMDEKVFHYYFNASTLKAIPCIPKTLSKNYKNNPTLHKIMFFTRLESTFPAFQFP